MNTAALAAQARRHLIRDRSIQKPNKGEPTVASTQDVKREALTGSDTTSASQAIGMPQGVGRPSGVVVPLRKKATALPEPDLGALDLELGPLDASQLIQWASLVAGDRLVMSTSFGIHSAAMLHLVTRMLPEIPVVWVDTGYLPAETYHFARELTERLNLNLKVYQSPISPARMEALTGRLWDLKGVEALDRYHRIRKVEPMQRALRELGATAWLAGLRAEQTEHRQKLRRVDRQWGRLKVLPILRWTAKDVHEYLRTHDLPYHPLFEQGYASVGDWHSSRPIGAHDRHERDTRFDGLIQECGLHLEDPPVDSAAAEIEHPFVRRLTTNKEESR